MHGSTFQTKVITLLLLLVSASLLEAQVGIGTATPTAKFEIKGSGTTSSTTSLRVLNSSSATPLIMVRDDGSVGIGTNSPASNAVLDLTSTNKGLLIPRMTASERTSISSPAIGLFVYQTDQVSGFYYYTGTEWKQLANVTSTAGSITSLDYANAKLEPTTYTINTPYTGVLKIPYSGGNGGSYANGSTINSTGVAGLSASLQGGTLNYGTGELVYNVSGTPTASSPATASFAIPSTLGAATGTAVVGSGTVLNIGEAITASYAIPKTTAEANGFDLSSHATTNNLTRVPEIDGLQANLAGNGSSFYVPKIKNTSSSQQTISFQTSAPSVNQYRTAINTAIASGVSVNVDYGDGNVYWTTSNAEIITTNVQVPVGNTYRWYEFKWWCMEVGTNKVIFISVVRNL
jgi:hypothetical protein